MGVGHEIDINLADLVADQRAATPTDAARIVVPDKLEVLSTLNYMGKNLQHKIAGQINIQTQILYTQAQAMTRFWQLSKEHLSSLSYKLIHQIDLVQNQIRLKSSQLLQTSDLIMNLFHYLKVKNLDQLKAQERLLKGFDVRAVLKRGYSIVTSQDRVLKNWTEVRAGQELIIQLHQGLLNATLNYGRKIPPANFKKSMAELRRLQLGLRWVT